MGIPSGNTVALAGDPGTGKTTFLLTYFRYGHYHQGKGVCLGQRQSTGETVDVEESAVEAAPTRIDQLILSTFHSQKNEEQGTLRCFISLESGFHRIRVNHRSLMKGADEGQPHIPARDAHKEDISVFIDATSFLSGRLEDRLRYPRLKDATGSAKLEEGWKPYDFSIGGYETQNELPILFWQKHHKGAPSEPPVRIDQISEPDSPFADHGLRFRFFNLATMPIADPMKRLRLLKDLLAELFSGAGENRHVLVAIDSLSALLSSFGMADPAALDHGGRRLHIINLVRWFEENEVTSLMACEAVRETGQTLRRQPLFLGTQERYVASGVIQLDYHQYRSGDLIRYFRILKMRGANHDMRPHAYELGPNGIAWIEPLYAEPESDG